jgi:hypothetical protein
MLAKQALYHLIITFYFKSVVVNAMTSSSLVPLLGFLQKHQQLHPLLWHYQCTYQQ